MTTATNIITSVTYDLKMTSTEVTARTSELIDYINRCSTNVITPMLVRMKSDLGVKAWTTTETTAYVPEYTLPTDFLSFYALYARTREHGGALASAASATSMTLDSDASDEDDTYNGMLFRMTSGDEADEQRYITDYDGDTVTATLSAALSGTPSATETFVIFKRPSNDDELVQMEVSELNEDYSETATEPEAYALSTETSLMLGPCPTTATVVLYGLYYYKHAALTAGANSLVLSEVFDEVVRQYVTESALLRDEYDVRAERDMTARYQDAVVSIIRERSRKKPMSAQSPIWGSRDY